MKASTDSYETAAAVVVVAVMLAVPFSCLIARAILWVMNGLQLHEDWGNALAESA